MVVKQTVCSRSSLLAHRAATRGMASQNIARDSGICLSAVKRKSKIPIRVSRSSSDSEQSCTEEPSHGNRYSVQNSRIPIAVSRQDSGSDSSEDYQNKTKPNTTDSGMEWIKIIAHYRHHYCHYRYHCRYSC